MNTKEITCTYLWKGWMTYDPDHPLVKETQQRISNYSKDDWSAMIADGNQTINKLKNLVISDVKIPSDEAYDAFNYLMNHVQSWFFLADKSYCNLLGYTIKTNYEYKMFFDKFVVGLSDKLSDLLLEYSHTRE